MTCLPAKKPQLHVQSFIRVRDERFHRLTAGKVRRAMTAEGWADFTSPWVRGWKGVTCDPRVVVDDCCFFINSCWWRGRMVPPPLSRLDLTKRSFCFKTVACLRRSDFHQNVPLYGAGARSFRKRSNRPSQNATSKKGCKTVMHLSVAGSVCYLCGVRPSFAQVLQIANASCWPRTSLVSISQPVRKWRTGSLLEANIKAAKKWVRISCMSLLSGGCFGGNKNMLKVSSFVPRDRKCQVCRKSGLGPKMMYCLQEMWWNWSSWFNLFFCWWKNDQRCMLGVFLISKRI